ncbi:excitatory amino acid transporter-like [Saccoglossus kowalevskii]|uniref:Amino acid transporter n=1 Tax=Saccoglossus kowalevskii TaxID=10224 RepID=A0A0U2UZA8_SACKO|nr:PREDICTED: putative sodium-dependent excitatory amino acid transporter glt-3-like [Saccoglossus kowalevskii]ALR88675.1 glutamate transporter-like 205 [Saccoglossus kowalevskii]
MVKVECSKSCWAEWAINNLLLILTMIGVAVGFILAFTVAPLNPSLDAIIWIGMAGELFLRGLQLLIIPLIVSSVITAVGSINLGTSGRMCAVTFTYIFAAMVVAVATGLIMTVIIQPGKTEGGTSDIEVAKYQTQDTFADLLRNLVPDNIVAACIQTAYTEYETDDVIVSGVNGTNVTKTVVVGKSVGMTSGTNMLGLVVFCISLGLAMSTDRTSTKPLLDLMMALRVGVFKMFNVYIWTLPVGTASLIASSLLRVDDMYGIWQSLGKFAAAVIVSLAIYEFIWMPLGYFASTRKNPFIVYYRIGRALFTALVSKSSAATLPVLFKCCEYGLKFHNKVCSFALPITMFKGDGSALFIICSVLWLGQRAGMDMGADQIALAGILTVILTFCLPAVPSASLVGIVLICNSTGIPSEEVGLLISMEWLLDALRTCVNVSSHGICTGIVNHFMRNSSFGDDDDDNDNDNISAESGEYTVKVVQPNSDDVQRPELYKLVDQNGQTDG